MQACQHIKNLQLRTKWPLLSSLFHTLTHFTLTHSHTHDVVCFIVYFPYLQLHLFFRSSILSHFFEPSFLNKHTHTHTHTHTSHELLLTWSAVQALTLATETVSMFLPLKWRFLQRATTPLMEWETHNCWSAWQCSAWHRDDCRCCSAWQLRWWQRLAARVDIGCYSRALWDSSKESDQEIESCEAEIDAAAAAVDVTTRDYVASTMRGERVLNRGNEQAFGFSKSDEISALHFAFMLIRWSLRGLHASHLRTTNPPTQWSWNSGILVLAKPDSKLLKLLLHAIWFHQLFMH